MLKRFAAALAIAAILSSTSRFACADDAPQRAFVKLVVAGVAAGMTLAIVSPEDVLLPQDVAVENRIAFTPTASIVVNGVAFISLKALRPRTVYAFDEATLTLTVSVDAANLGTKTYDFNDNPNTRGLVADRPKSAFVNYYLSGAEGGAASGYFETGVSAHDSLFYSNESIQTDGRAQRGQTYFSHDDVAHLRHEVVGDVTVGSSDALFGQVDVFGAGVQREFAIDPYAYYFPTPSVAGVLSTPGTAEVYIDGLLAHSTPLGPGGFDLTNIPVTTGNSDVSVVVRDAGGHVRTYDQTFFATNSLLRRGLTDYSYGVGLLRLDDDDYDNVALAGSYRLGASDRATYGGELAVTAHRSQAGAMADLKIGSLLVHASEGAGIFDSRFATASNVALDYRLASTSIGAAATLRGANFNTNEFVATTPLEPARFEFAGNLSQQIGRGTSVVASYFRQTFTTLAAQTTSIVSISRQIHNAFLLATYSDVRSGATAAIRAVGFSLTQQIGRTSSVALNDSYGNGAERGIELQHNAPSDDVGLGYALQYENGTTSSLLASAVAHEPVADINVYAQSSAGRAPTGSLEISGAVVASDGHVLATRPVRDAFALVETGGIADIPVAVDGRSAGRTDANGLLVVPSIGSFSESRITLDDSLTPLGVEVDHTDAFVAPGARGGSVASFKVKRVSYFVGNVADRADGTLVLSRGVRLFRSALDDRGGFYFENLDAGNYRATVTKGITQCTFMLVVPHTTSVANDLGSLACAP